jgi:hypothetical protein
MMMRRITLFVAALVAYTLTRLVGKIAHEKGCDDDPERRSECRRVSA